MTWGQIAEHNRLHAANTTMRERGLNTVSRLKVRANEARMAVLLDSSMGRGAGRTTADTQGATR